MFSHPQPHRRWALSAAALAGACITATFGLAPDSIKAASNVSVQARVLGGVVEITGTGGADVIVVRPASGAPTTLQVDVGGNGTPDFSFAADTFSSISVKPGAGADTVTGTNGLADLAQLRIDGGDGDDKLTGGDGADVIFGGPGRDTVDGKRGNDVVLLGDDDDRTTWDPGDGSDVIDGQAGNDVLGFTGSNASEHLTVTSLNAQVRVLRDIALVAVRLREVERLELNPLSGNDVIAVGDITGTELKVAAIDLAATGGGGDAQADTVTVNGTPGTDRIDVRSPKPGTVLVTGLTPQVQVFGSEAANDHMSVATQAGDDTIVGHVGTTGPADITFDGGLGSDVTTYDGTSAADAISVSPNGSGVRMSAPASVPVNSSAIESFVVRAGAGADAVTSASGLAALGRLRIDGGPGDDRLSGGDGDDVLIGGTGNDTVSGGRGNDVALLGADDDRFTWGPGDGNDAVEGEAGNDVLGFNGSNAPEHITVSADGPKVRVVRDIALVAMDLHGVERLEVNALFGADVITVDDLAGTDLKAAAVDLSATGGGGDAQADTVTVNGTPGVDRVAVTRDVAEVLTSGLAAQTRIVGSEPANDTLRVATLGGDDQVTVAPDVSALIKAVVDLGADG